MLQNMLKHTFIFTAVPVGTALRADDAASNPAAGAALRSGGLDAQLLIDLGC